MLCALSLCHYQPCFVVTQDVLCWQDEWVPQNVDEEMASADNTEDESEDNEDDDDTADQGQKSTQTPMERDSDSDDSD